jgi:hypothetical protein
VTYINYQCESLAIPDRTIRRVFCLFNSAKEDGEMARTHYVFSACLLATLWFAALAFGFDDRVGAEYFNSAWLSPDGTECTRILEEILAIKAAGSIPAQQLYGQLALLMPPVHRDRDPLDQGNDACPATLIGGVPYTDGGTTVGRANNFVACLANTAPDVIYSFTPTTTAAYAISLCGSGYDTALELRTGGACPGTTNVACNDDACGIQSHLVATLTAGTTYFIIVDGFASESGAYILSVALDVPCDVPCQPGDRLECTELPDTSHARLDCNGACNNLPYGGTANFGEIACGQTVCGAGFTYVRESSSFRDTDWYQFSIGNTQDIQMTVTAEFNAILGIVNLNNCVGTTFAGVTTTIPCLTATLTVPALPPGTYAMIVAPNQFTGIPAPLTYRATLTACSDCDQSESAMIVATMIDTIGTKATTRGYCVPIILPPGTVIEDYSLGVIGSVSTTSRLYWIDPGSGRMFDHGVYYVIVDTLTGAITQILDGQSWPIINLIEWGIESLAPHTFYIGNFIGAPDVFYAPNPLSVPFNRHRRGALDDPSKWAVLISQADTAGNSYEAKCSKADIDCARSSLGSPTGPGVPDSAFTTHIRPTWAQVCTTLAQLGRANPPCDKLYIYYTGHGGDTGAKMRGTTLTWAQIAQKIKDANAKEVCVIWQSCHSGSLIEELAKIGVNGYHISSTTPTGESTWELPGDPVAGSPVSRFVWQCMTAGYKGQDLYAWALTQWNAYNHWYCDYLHDQVVRRRITAADSARLKNYWITTTPGPTGAQTGGTTAKGGSIELPPAAACSTLCFTFYAPPGSCANATILCQRIVGTDTTWVRVRHWNFNRNETRYFNPFENPDPNSTGRYRVVNDGNTDVLNVKIVWLLVQQPSTPNAVYADAIPSHSIGWVDNSNAEFNPFLTTGTFNSFIVDGFNTYEIPRCFGPAWPDTFRWHFPLLPHPEHPWLYNGGDPLGGFNLPTELRINIAGVFINFEPSTFGQFEVHIDFVDNPSGIYTHLVQQVQTTRDFSSNTYSPVTIQLPPIVRPYPLTITLTSIQGFPYQIAVDAATLTAVGDYNDIPPPECIAVDDLTVIRMGGQVRVNFTAPQDALYRISSSPQFGAPSIPETVLPGLAGQALSWTDPNPTLFRKFYSVIADCGGGELRIAPAQKQPPKPKHATP